MGEDPLRRPLMIIQGLIVTVAWAVVGYASPLVLSPRASVLGALAILVPSGLSYFFKLHERYLWKQSSDLVVFAALALSVLVAPPLLVGGLLRL